MSYINFIISRINYLPYYMPLVMEGNQRGIKSNFFLVNSGKKFVSPYQEDHMKELQTLAKEHNIKLYDITKIGKFPAITFFCEGDIVGKDDKNKPSPSFKHMTSQHIKVSIVCNYEYVMFYKNYINNVDYCILPHKYWEGYYQLISPKNLYLGSPKYDMKYYNRFDDTIDRNDYLTAKYGLDLSKKYILVIFPKDPKKHHKKETLYPNKKVLLDIYSAIRDMGYKVIVKNRKQDTLKDAELKGDYYYEDIDHHPCNSMELIEISHMVIFFSSSINEECVAMKTPYIDLKVDLLKNRFECLNHLAYGICWSYANLVQFDIRHRIMKFIKYLEEAHYKPDKVNSDMIYTNYHTKIVWEGGKDASKRIIDWVEQQSNTKKQLNDAIKA